MRLKQVALSQSSGYQRCSQERLRLRGMRGALGGGELSRRSPLASDLLQLLSWHQPDSYRSSCNIDRGIGELDTKDGEALYDPLPMDWDWRKKWESTYY